MWQKRIVAFLAMLLVAFLPMTTKALTVKPGDSGSAVMAVQVVLRQEGYLSGSCDGVFGTATSAALKAYQKAHGLTQDGKAGAKTLAAMGLCTTDPVIGEATISEGKVNLRRGPSTSHQILFSLKRGDRVAVLAENDAWFRVRTAEEIEGYLYKSYCTVAGALEDAPIATATVVNVNDAVNLRKGAGTDTALIGTVKKGATVSVIKAEGAWYQVRTADGKTGYISKSYLKLNTVAAPTPLTLTVNRQIGTVVNVSTAVNLRKGAGTGTALLGTVKKGAQVNVLEAAGSWYHVQTASGLQGYISKTYLKIETVQQQLAVGFDPTGLFESPITGTVINVTTAELKVRAKAGTNSDILATLKNGATVTVYGKEGAWYQVCTAEGVFGYCSETYIRTEEPAQVNNPISGTLRSGMNNSDVALMQQRLKELGYFTATATGYFGSQTLSAVKAFQAANGLTKDGIAGPKTLNKLFSNTAIAKNGNQGELTEAEKLQAKLQAMVNFAKQYLGKPYVSGGNGPNSFDCSGFTKYVYQNTMNYTLPRTAYTQGYNAFGTKITKVKDLKIGDLVFFNTNANDSDLCDHVGIYVGDNQFIHASSGNGMKVVLSTLGGTIYERLFSWGKRVFG